MTTDVSAGEYTGKRIFMETLLAEGTRYIFGNPGTTELPIMDSLLDYPELDYILSLQEAVAVTMADAYAQASGRVGVVNLHVAPGLGNGIGSLYNAWEGQTPLLVTAGQQDNRMRLREPLLGHDLVAMAAPVTKWSVEAQSADELPLLLNRAFKTARETPSGPVFVSLPMNVMEQRTRHAPLAPSHVYTNVPPDPAGVEEAAGLLLASRRPVILCGDKVARAGAICELVALAETLGAGVFSELLPARVNFPNQHPQFRDRMAHDQALIRERIGDADVVLMVGGEFFEEVWFVDTLPFPPACKLIQIDPAVQNVGRNYPVHCGLVADPKPALEALNREFASRADDAYKQAAAGRRAECEAKKLSERESQAAAADRQSASGAMSSARLMVELREALPENTSIAAEAITASVDMLRTLPFTGPEDFMASRGGGIGQAPPSAIGVKLAYPDRPVLGISGDGGSLYTIQALWTAAHHAIPVVFLILNNATYRILKLNMNRYRGEAGIDAGRRHPHVDLSEPAVDFCRLARGFGVESRRVERAEEVGPALRQAFASGAPWLLDVVIDGSV